MMAISSDTSRAGHAAEAKSPRWPLWVFRGTATLAAIMLFDQAVFAGQFLAGTYDALLVHRESATFAGISVVVSAIGAALLRWPGRGPWWPIAACLGLFGLIALQIIIGFARILTLHVPLGVMISILATELAVWAWRAGR